MPSFDIVSEVDLHELTNAVDQANREIATRFDFKNSGAKFELNQEAIELTAPVEFQIQQMQPILEAKLIKRKIDIQCLEWQSIETNLSQARQEVKVNQGINQETAKKIIKLIKAGKHKVQASVNEDKVRVNGKKRDELQQVITLLKEESLNIPLQFKNFRD